jgi:lysozyme
MAPGGVSVSTVLNVDALLSELVEEEGLSFKPYRDSVGKLTIGVGHNLDDNGITLAEARSILADDLAAVEAQLDKQMPWWRSLDDVRQRVIADMAFNMGITTFLTFHGTLADVRTGQYESAAAGMLASLWARQVGRRARRLAEMMRTGQPVALSQVPA